MCQAVKRLIETNYQEVKEELVTRLQERIAGNSPFFFEELVINLLVQMGYGAHAKTPKPLGAVVMAGLTEQLTRIDSALMSCIHSSQAVGSEC